MTCSRSLFGSCVLAAFLVSVSEASEEKEYTTLSSKHRLGFLGVTFSPDGKLVAAAGLVEDSDGRGHLTIWSSETGNIVYQNRSFPATCGRIDFSPDGTLLAVTCGDRSTYVLQRRLVQRRQRWEQVARLPRESKPLSRLVIPGRVQFNESGEQLVHTLFESQAPERGCEVQLWNTSEFARPVQSWTSVDGFVAGLRFIGAERILVAEATFPAPTIHVLDVESGELEGILRLENAPQATHLPTIDVHREELLAVGGEDYLALVDLEMMEVHRMLDVPDEVIRVVCFSPDGRLLASCGSDHVIRLWDVDTGRQIAERNQDWVTNVAFSPDGFHFATIGLGSDGVRIWNVQSLVPAK